MNKQQEPRLLFKGFTGNWEENVLEEVVNFFSGLTYSPNDVVKNGTLVLRSSNVQDNQITTEDNVFVKESAVNCRNVEVGDVIVVVRNGSRSLIGKHAIIKEKKPNTVIGAFITGIRSNQPDFLNALLDSYKFNQEIEKNLGATINQITTGAFRKMEFSLPSLPEQTHLGLFFRRLDSQIAESRAVLEKSRQLKKAMLAKMYPANGEKIPKIRFKGFDGEWECRKLGELCTITTGKLDANAMTENGRYDFFTSGIKKYKIDHYAFIGPAITIAGNGATIGYMHYADGYFNAYQRTYVLTGIQANRNFIFSEINQKLQNKIKQESRAGNIPYIVLDMLTELSIDIPTIEEQTAIGNFFRQLDETIALQTAEVEKLNQLKKGLLAAMLV